MIFIFSLLELLNAQTLKSTNFRLGQLNTKVDKKLRDYEEATINIGRRIFAMEVKGFIFITLKRRTCYLW